MESKLNNNLEGLLEKLENFLNTKTVVGEPIHIGETILVPLVDVAFGVGVGASAAAKMQEKTKNKEKQIDGGSDAGAGGLGAKITPSAMLVIQNGTTQLINIRSQDSLSKIIDMVPGIISNIPDVVSKIVPNDNVQTKKKKTAQSDEYHNLDN
ncbi:MAG: GerW family sporulation protein [Cellulosilyticaceae bacterium]